MGMFILFPGNGRYNVLLLLTCCIIMLGAVVDMLGYSLVVPAASCDLDLSLEHSGMLTSVSFAGMTQILFLFSQRVSAFSDNV